MNSGSRDEQGFLANVARIAERMALMVEKMTVTVEALTVIAESSGRIARALEKWQYGMTSEEVREAEADLADDKEKP